MDISLIPIVPFVIRAETRAPLVHHIDSGFPSFMMIMIADVRNVLAEDLHYHHFHQWDFFR